MLKQIILALQTGRETEGKEKVLKALDNAGVQVIELFAGDRPTYVPGRAIQSEGKAPERTLAGVQDTLWITDAAQIATEIQEAGGMVLGYSSPEEESTWMSGVSYVFESWNDLDYDYFLKVYQRMRGLPWNILETDRCIIRESTVEDVDAFYEIYGEPSVTRYMENLFADRAEEIAYMESYREHVYAYYGYGMWTVVEKESGRIIGRAGLSHREGYEDAELGFVIGVPWQHQGFAYEVCSAIVQYGVENLGFTSMQALTAPDNEASKKLCTKLGFVCRKKIIEGGSPYLLYQYETAS